MAQLTWKNVDSPTFSSVTDALRLSGESFNRGMDSARKGIEGFEKDQTQAATAALMAQGLKYQDAGSFKNALMDGTALAGVDLTKVDPEALRWMGNRSTVLFNEASQAATTDQTRQTTQFQAERHPLLMERDKLYNDTARQTYDQTAVTNTRENNEYAARGEWNQAAATMRSLAQRGTPEDLAELNRMQQDPGVIGLATKAGVKDIPGFINSNTEAVKTGQLGTLADNRTWDQVAKARFQQIIDSGANEAQVNQMVQAFVGADGPEVASRLTEMIGKNKAILFPQGDINALREAEVQRRAGVPGIDITKFGTGGAAARRDSFNFTPDFQGGLTSLISSAPPEIQKELKISSGYRSPETQAGIMAEHITKKLGPEAAQRWQADVAAKGAVGAGQIWQNQLRQAGITKEVGLPGGSNHQKGQAADLSYLSPAAKKWVHDNAAKHGLAFPLANEPWHIEAASARGGGAQTVRQATAAGYDPVADVLAAGGGPTNQAAAALSKAAAQAARPSSTEDMFTTYDRGTSVASIADTALTESQVDRSQNTLGPIANAIIDPDGDKKPIGHAAREIFKQIGDTDEGGLIATTGMTDATITGILQEIKEKYGVNTAVAGAALSSAITKNGNWFSKDTREVDWKTLDREMGEFYDGKGKLNSKAVAQLEALKQKNNVEGLLKQEKDRITKAQADLASAGSNPRANIENARQRAAATIADASAKIEKLSKHDGLRIFSQGKLGNGTGQPAPAPSNNPPLRASAVNPLPPANAARVSAALARATPTSPENSEPMPRGASRLTTPPNWNEIQLRRQAAAEAANGGPLPEGPIIPDDFAIPQYR